MAKQGNTKRAPILPQPRLWFLCIDPSETRTGFCLGHAMARIVMGDRLQVDAGSRTIVRVWSERPPKIGGFRDMGLSLTGLLGLSVIGGERWVPVIERPPSARFGGKASSLPAFKWWHQWGTDIAHDRGSTLKFEDALLDPQPSIWRAPLGLPVKAPPTVKGLADRADWMKAKSVEYAGTELARFGCDPFHRPSNGLPDHDAAEAVCLFAWACRSVGTIGTWVDAPRGMRRLLSLA